MWSLYAKAGVVVKTDVASLKAALPVSQDFLITRVRYVTRDPENPSWWIGWDRLNDPQLVLRPFLVKSSEYKHEHEVRVTAFCEPRTAGWLFEDINVQNLIKEIVVSPSVPHGEFCAIERYLRMRFDQIFPANVAPQPKIRQSVLRGHLIEDERLSAEVAQFFSNTTALGEPNYLNEL